MNTVTRKMELDVKGDKYSVDVTLSVDIGEGATYYLIDEIYPEGWTVTTASDYGSYVQDPGHIKWVVIMGAHDKDYTYTIEMTNPPQMNVFPGLYMVEGHTTEQDILGQSVLDIDIHKEYGKKLENWAQELEIWRAETSLRIRAKVQIQVDAFRAAAAPNPVKYDDLMVFRNAGSTQYYKELREWEILNPKPVYGF